MSYLLNYKSYRDAGFVKNIQPNERLKEEEEVKKKTKV